MEHTFLDKLVAARCQQQQIRDLSPSALPGTLSQAYDLQGQLSLALQQQGKGQPVGHKIGCTTQVMQRYLEIDHPCAGQVFQSTVAQERLETPLSNFVRAGVECEIAVTLGRDLPQRDIAWQPEDLIPYIDSACASIELVDDRFDDYSRYGVCAMVADDFFNSGIVLGTPVSFDRQLDLSDLSGCIRINGQQAGQGTGQEILGNPLTALAWLAAHLQDRGRHLKAGAFVTLGSVVKTQWIDQPDTLVEIEFTTLGKASVHFC